MTGTRVGITSIHECTHCIAVFGEREPSASGIVAVEFDSLFHEKSMKFCQTCMAGPG